jgi:hypothetical protein
MSLMVETGNIVAGAESYVEVTDADSYHSNRQNADWGVAVTAAKEAALRKATSYIDIKYSQRWKGQRCYPAQPLMWPRNYVLQYEEEGFLGYASSPVYINSNVIPQLLKDAVCEAALRALSSPLDDDLVNGIQSIAISGAITTVYANHSGDEIKTYPIIERLISSLVKSSNKVVRG